MSLQYIQKAIQIDTVKLFGGKDIRVIDIGGSDRETVIILADHFDSQVLGVETVKDEIIDRLIEKVYGDVRRKN